MSAADPGDPAALPGGAAGAGDAAGAGAPPAQRAASTQPAFSRSASAQPPPGPAPDPASPTSDAASVSATATATATATASVNADNPWLGLASFTEETRAFFYGREQEITELERRVQRKLLTVLFGKSGLGKTSILQAGLVPGLRARGYFPVYLRIDYGHDSPEASEQIKQAINRAAVRAGDRGERGERGESAGAAGREEAAARGTTAEGIAAEEAAAQGAGRGPAAETPAIDPEESIWEFLHHREGAQSSEAVPGDVSAETRTVKSPATQTATTGSAAPAAPAAPLGATASTVPLGATAPPIATAPLRPIAPPTSTPAITAIPLLIFDQFEELFTLAQSDEFGRARAARFVEELADLVENRPPKALEAKLDSDDSLSERFDFSRSDYRVVISLREDYLAPLESLKRQMPSLSQNRLRLAPMTGDQALEAVLLPGQRLAEDSVLPGRRRGAGAAQWSGRPLEAGGQLGAGAALEPARRLDAETAQLPGRPPGAGRPPLPGRALVTEEVAEAIVRFVAGGAELANAEVEPSLLSLICRELNEQRLAQHHSEISLGLLAGSRESILGSFYERALADQPPAVRSLIEDELLTESGYRENLAEESLLRKLQTAGAAPDALAKLVNRRLLRIEERLDVRRVELTHDVLTGVVKASRDQRHEREARAATERLLAEQAARESAARRALRRARAIAAGCTALAVAAVIAAIFAVVNVQRARHAEADARQTRAVSEQARQQAEGLLGFLTDDFVRELETFGRYQTIAELTQREIDYFQHLPPQLKDPASIRNGALALINHARALSFVGDASTADKNLTEAVALLEQLRRGGDRSDSTAVVLARAYMAVSPELLPDNSGGFTDLNRALDLLRPIAGRAGSSAAARRAYLDALQGLGTEDVTQHHIEDAVRTEREAMRLATQLGARRLGDVTLDRQYVSAEDSLTALLVGLGRNEEAHRVGEDALGAVDQVLAQRPQYGGALINKQDLARRLTALAINELDPADALRVALQEVQTCLALIKIEPRNERYANQLGIAYDDVGDSLWSAGRLRESIPYARKVVDAFGQASAGGTPVTVTNLAISTSEMVGRQASLGDLAGVSATLAATDAFMSRPRNRPSAGSVTQATVNSARTSSTAILAYDRDDFGTTRRIARNAMARLRAVRPGAGIQTILINAGLCAWSTIEGQAEYRLGAFAAAEQAERAALKTCTIYTEVGNSVATRRSLAAKTTWLSMALAGEGKRAEAAQTIGPVVTMYRALVARNHGDQWLPLELAEALYAQSLTDDAHRAALLREAAQRVDHLVPTIAALHDTRAWRARIEAAQRSVATVE